MNQGSPDAESAMRFVDRQNGSVDWRGLEQAAFDGYPNVQRAIAESIDEVLQPPRKGQLPLAFLLFLLELGPIFAFGVAAVSTRASSRESMIPLVLVSVIGALYIVQQLALRRSMHHDIREIDPRRVVLAWVNVAFALITLAWILIVGRAIVIWPVAALVTAATIVVALTTASRMRQLGKQVSGEQLEAAMKRANPVERSRAAVEALSEAQQQAVRDRLDAVIDSLQTVQIVDAHTAADAKRQPLGALGRWEAARRLLNAGSERNAQ